MLSLFRWTDVLSSNYIVYINSPSRASSVIEDSHTLREKCLNTEFFLVRIFRHSDQKKLHIWTLFTQWHLLLLAPYSTYECLILYEQEFFYFLVIESDSPQCAPFILFFSSLCFVLYFDFFIYIWFFISFVLFIRLFVKLFFILF